jgi:hypothetical protein
MAVSAASADCVVAAAVLLGAGVDSELVPQALRASPTMAAPAVSVIAGERRLAIRSIPSTEAELTDEGILPPRQGECVAPNTLMLMSVTDLK